MPNFATIIPGVQNGKYQVGQDNFGATKAREQVVDFEKWGVAGTGEITRSTLTRPHLLRARWKGEAMTVQDQATRPP